MTPLRIYLQAFGPFAGVEEIDFLSISKDYTNSLLLICGPTGAGKSSIIDAMSYALFGETCTEGRNGEELRSHFCKDSNIPTIVEFDFAIGADKYRIIRSPKQTRARKRGSGFLVDEAKATLLKIGGIGANASTTVAAKPSEVSDFCVKQLGVNAKQFRQVVVLPQGRFRDFLIADVKSREAILETIFGTEFYKTIQEKLKEKAQSLVGEYEKLKFTRVHILSSQNVSNSAELSGLKKDLETQTELKQSELVLFNKETAKANVHLQKALKDEQSFAEIDSINKRLELLLRNQPNIDRQASLLEIARKAEPLKQFESEWKTAVKNLRDAHNEKAITTSSLSRKVLELKECKDLQRENEIKAKQRFVEAEADLHNAIERHQRLQEKWNLGRAAELAKQLTHNHPCPVCGSLVHPEPAQKSELHVDADDLNHSLKQIKALNKTLDSLRETPNSSDKVSFIEQSVSELKGKLALIEKLTLATEQVAKKAEEKFVSELKKNHFEKIEDFEKAFLPAEKINSIEQEIRKHSQNLFSCREQFEWARNKTSGKIRPNISEVDATYQTAFKKSSETARELGGLESQIRKLDESITLLGKLDSQIADLDEKVKVIKPLASIANGNNDKNLTWQRFVLGEMLNEVLLAASDQLLETSLGRYHFRRNDRVQDGRTAAGLDIDVVDEWTGLARSVTTLSGGESFLAALALALGLSEVVQSYAGGIRLQTLIIDEGFGSLDAEALERVFEALTNLRHSGRFVAIVSHVEELKNRIPFRLEIECDKVNGSRIKI